MTPVEIASSIVGIVIGAITPLILGYWRWADKREAMMFQHKQAIQEAAWKQADVEHKRRMELAALTAARAATESVKEVQSSKVERSAQVGELKVMIQENTNISKTAFDAANHMNEKIQTLGLDLVAENRNAAAGADHMEVKTVTIEAQTVEVHPEKPAKP